MIPTPVSLLIHSATLQTAAKDRYQENTVYTTVANLTRIRVEPSSKQLLGANGTQKQLTAMLIFDVRNSRPTNPAFTAGQYLLFNGSEYRVESVDTLYDQRKLHHFEVGLSG